MSKVNVYCLKCFNNLRANLHKWGKGNYDWDRSITRDYYHAAFDCGNPFPTNLISKEALVDWYDKKEIVTDHCYSPQFIGRFVMDNADQYLNNFDLFKDLFIKSLTTIQVTAKQNTELRNLTKHRNGVFKIKQPTYNKYNYLNIQLYKKESDETWDKSVPTDNILDVPEELTLYEEQYLVS